MLKEECVCILMGLWGKFGFGHLMKNKIELNPYQPPQEMTTPLKLGLVKKYPGI